MSRRPDLIVPIHDRRKRTRILTLKNFAIVMAVLVVGFVGVSIHSEMRGRTSGDFGRLFRREQPPPVAPKPMDVIREEAPPVADATHANPMLVEPMARSQWLLDETATTQAEMTTPVVVNAASVRGDAEVTIVGGTEGVTIVKRERKRPVLSGGFGR